MRFKFREGFRAGFALLAALVAAELSSGCVSLSTMQTARAVPDGILRSDVAVSVVTSAPANSNTSVYVPVPEVALRYGIGGGRDLGIKAGPLGTQFEFKQEVVSQGPLVIAVAPATGFIYSTSAPSGSGSGSVGSFVFHLPLLFGVDLNGGHQVIFGPRLSEFVYWSQSGGATSRTVSNAATLLGASFGLALSTSKALVVMPEVNFATKVAGDGPQGGVGFQFGLGFMFGG